MHRRLYPIAAPLALLLLAGGCVQATRHSNTMVFGTNTTVGLQVGSGVDQIPSITVGYDRQEIVIMPLVANTGETKGQYGDDLLQPCDLTSAINVTDTTKFAVHPCSLVAINGSALDSYSVLASFGAEFDGSASATQAGAKGGLAQYFATGIAAQILAQNGGAAVVAVGPAAAVASNDKMSPAELRAMFNNPTAFQLGVGASQTYPQFFGGLRALVATAPDDATVAAKIKTFEENSGINTAMRTSCATKAGCLSALDDEDYYQTYVMNSDKMTAALGKW